MDVWDLMPGIMKVYALFGLLLYAAGIIAIVVFIFAIWHGMKAHVKLAASMERMAKAIERIEETIRRNQTGL
jgi:hypothetical protein